MPKIPEQTTTPNTSVSSSAKIANVLQLLTPQLFAPDLRIRAEIAAAKMMRECCGSEDLVGIKQHHILIATAGNVADVNEAAKDNATTRVLSR